MVDRFFRGNPMFKPIEPVSLPPLAPRLGMFWSTQSCPKLGILLGAHQQPVLHQLSQWVQGILVDFIQELIVKNVREKTYTFPGQKKRNNGVLMFSSTKHLLNERISPAGAGWSPTVDLAAHSHAQRFEPGLKECGQPLGLFLLNLPMCQHPGRTVP